MFNGEVKINKIEALPGNGEIVLDEDLRALSNTLDAGIFHAVVVRTPIEENYFVRLIDYDYENEQWKRENPRPIILFSTYQMDWIATEHQIDFAHLVAVIIWKFKIVYDFLRNGGRYFSLYAVDRVESSIFNFCRKKVEVVDCYRAMRIGPRATAVLNQQYLSDDQIRAWEADIKRLQISVFRKILIWFNKNSVASSYVSGIITGITSAYLIELVK
ncbi:MAG: hypothetical protein ACKOEE_02865 [Tagaea sp.]